MKKSLLAKIPVNTFKYVSMEILQNDVELLYAARRLHINSEYILEVTFYSLKEHRVVYRAFFSKNDYVIQIFDADDRSKYRWSTSKLDNALVLQPYVRRAYSNKYDAQKEEYITRYTCHYCELNKRTKNIISSFMLPKIRNYYRKADDTADMLVIFQTIVSKKRLEQKHKKIIAQIDAKFTKIEKLPANIKKWFEKVPLIKNSYIFYKRKGSKITGYCTACKKNVELEFARHKSEIFCPCCGTSVTALAAGRRKRIIMDDFVFTYIQKHEDNGIMLRIFYGTRFIGSDYENPEISYHEVRRYIINSDLKTFNYYFGNFKNTGIVRWCDTMPGGYYFQRHTDMGYLYTGNLTGQFTGTHWQDSRIQQFGDLQIPFYAMDYLSAYYQYRGITYLMDNKLYSLVNEAISFSGYSMFSEDTVFKILMKHRQFQKLFAEIDITWSDLQFVNELKSFKYIKRDLLLWVRQNVKHYDFTDILDFTTPAKAINYIEKQALLCGETKNQILITWLDCLRYAKSFKHDTSDTMVLFPRNLIEKHDAYVAEDARLSELERKKEARKIQRRIRALTPKINQLYGYEGENFIVRAPNNANEIAEEGKILRHCVGNSYYSREMAEGKTVILFLREKPDIDKPFCTIEYANGDVRQFRIYQNQNAPEHVKAYKDEWLEYINKNKQFVAA